MVGQQREEKVRGQQLQFLKRLHRLEAVLRSSRIAFVLQSGFNSSLLLRHGHLNQQLGSKKFSVSKLIRALH